MPSKRSTSPAPRESAATHHPQQHSPFGEFVRTYWGPIVGLSSLLFALAAGHSTLSQVTTQAGATAASVRELERRIEAHSREPWHATAGQRFLELDRRLEQIERDQRDASKEMRSVAERVERVNENIIALCAATRGARCK